MIRKCIFCGSGPVNREHVWAQWLRSVPSLLSPGPVTYIQIPSGRTQFGDRRRQGTRVGPKGIGKPIDVTAKCVCPGCNSGWLGDLEQLASPILTPLIEGTSGELTPASQFVVATWAAKTALLHQYTQPDTVPNRPFLLSYHEELFARKGPPTNVQVWLGATTLSNVRLRCTTQRVSSFSIPGASEHASSTGFVSTLVIGCVVIQLFGHTLAGSITIDHGFLAPYLPQIWPARGHVRWPPERLIVPAMLDTVSSAFDSASPAVGMRYQPKGE